MAIQGNTVGTMGPDQEALASFPEVPRRNIAGDGTEPRDREPHRPPSKLAPAGQTLADVDGKTAFKVIEALVRSQDRIARNRWAIDTHFDRVRSGVPFSRLEKVPNQAVWVAKLPNGMTKETTGAVPNKADDLCNKVEDTLMADPPKLTPEIHDEEEATRAAAELVADFLHLDGGEAGTNDTETYRWALNNALSRAASFLHYRVNPSGGGYQPLQKLAHPQATDPARPMVALVNGIADISPNPVLRYVSAPTPDAPAGQFVPSAEQADRVWLPKLVIDRLRREQVRTFPVTAPIDRASACIIVRWQTVAEWRQECPDTVGQMPSEQLAKLASWRPPMSETFVVPYAFRGMSEGYTGPSVEDVGSFAPLLQRRMYAYRFYIACSPEYPEGYWTEVNGNADDALASGDLQYIVEIPVKGKVPRCRDLPVVMVRPMQDVSGGDPMGWPFISRFAGSAEATATLLAAFSDYCDNMLHPHVFLRSTSSVDEDDWADRTTPTLLGPSDPEPTYEHFPNLPPILQLAEFFGTAQDTASGLTATAQGLDSPNAASGVAKQLTVRQALVSLSGFQQNLHAAMTRGGRLKCQLVQSAFDIPQLLQYAGEAGSAEPRWWTGADFAGIDRVGIQPGTGTMMTPEGKAQYVAFLQSQQWMAPDAAAEIALPSIRMDLGIPEPPVDAALERSITAWLEGPPEGWVAAQQQYVQQQQMFDQQQQAMQAQQAHAQQQGMVDQQTQQVAAQKKIETDAQLQMERQKHDLAMQAADQQHRQKMELDTAQHTRQMAEKGQAAQAERDAQLAHQSQLHADSEGARATDFANLKDALLAHKAEPPTVHVHVPESPAPVVTVHPPAVHVHVPEGKAPIVNVPKQDTPAPIVHVEQPRAEIPKPRGKRKHKVKKNPDGSYDVEES